MAGQPGRPRERRERFSTISGVEIRRVYGPVDWAATPTGDPPGPGGPTAIDHHGDPLPRGRWDVGSALAALRDAAGRPGSSETNLMPHFIRCAEAYATLGEQCAVLREVFGECREPAAI